MRRLMGEHGGRVAREFALDVVDEKGNQQGAHSTDRIELKGSPVAQTRDAALRVRRVRKFGRNTGGWSRPRCSSSSIAGTWSGAILPSQNGSSERAGGDQVDHRAEALQIDGVLGEPARAEHPRRDAERGRWPETMIAVKQVDKLR